MHAWTCCKFLRGTSSGVISAHQFVCLFNLSMCTYIHDEKLRGKETCMGMAMPLDCMPANCQIGVLWRGADCRAGRMASFLLRNSNELVHTICTPPVWSSFDRHGLIIHDGQPNFWIIMESKVRQLLKCRWLLGGIFFCLLKKPWDPPKKNKNDTQMNLLIPLIYYELEWAPRWPLEWSEGKVYIVSTIKGSTFVMHK